MLARSSAQPGLAQGHRRRRRARQRARAQQVQHAVLDHLGVSGQWPEGAVVQPGEHGIGDVAHAGLQRQQLGRQPPVSHLMAQELQHVTSDPPRIAIDWLERRAAIRGVRRDNRDDLLLRAVQVRYPDPVVGLEDLDRLPVRRQGGAVVDVVHALHLDLLPGVHLEDHLVGQIEPRLVVAHRRRRDQLAVCGDPCDLDQRGIEMPEESLPHHLGHV